MSCTLLDAGGADDPQLPEETGGSQKRGRLVSGDAGPETSPPRPSRPRSGGSYRHHLAKAVSEPPVEAGTAATLPHKWAISGRPRVSLPTPAPRVGTGRQEQDPDPRTKEP